MKVLLGVLGAFFLVELGTRYCLPKGNWTPGQGLASNALRLGQNGILLNKPNLHTYTCVNLEPWTALDTDNRGFRVPRNQSRESAGDVRERILVLGASNTWGMGVTAEDTWPQIFQGLLAERGRTVEIMNGAQVGYTLPHMFERARQLANDIALDRIFIAVPSSGLYMFGLGSAGSPWHFVHMHPWQVTPLPLEYAFDQLPQLEEVNGFVLRRDRAGRGGFIDDLRTQSALIHRIWVKASLRQNRFDVVKEETPFDLAELVKKARNLGREFCELEDDLSRRGIRLHLVFFPAQWGDLVLRNDDTQMAVLGAFQKVARVGLRRFPRADLSGDPKYRIDLDKRLGKDVLIDGRHLSARGHAKVAASLARWYFDKGYGR